MKTNLISVFSIYVITLFLTFLQGFDRVFDVLDDISIDVPLAPAVLERFLDKCINAGFLQRDVLHKMPPARYYSCNHN